MVNTRETTRIGRMKWLEKSIRSSSDAGLNVDLEKLIAITCLEFGCSRRTALEYINTLVKAGRVTLERKDIIFEKTKPMNNELTEEEKDIIESCNIDLANEVENDSNES